MGRLRGGTELGPSGNKEGGSSGWKMPTGQTALATWPWDKAGLHPQDCGDPVGGAELGVVELDGGADPRGTGLEDPSGRVYYSDFARRVEMCWPGKWLGDGRDQL